FLADVAPVCVLANCVAMFLWDGSLQLDREIREASRGIEDTGIEESTRRARVQASCARTALIECRRIRAERQTADNLGQKNPGAEIFVDETCVLPDPSKPGILGVDAFLHRPGVDVGAGFERVTRDLAKTRDQL